MHAITWLKALLTVDDSILNEQFMLTPEDGNITQDSQQNPAQINPGEETSQASSGSSGGSDKPNQGADGPNAEAKAKDGARGKGPTDGTEPKGSARGKGPRQQAESSAPQSGGGGGKGSQPLSKNNSGTSNEDPQGEGNSKQGSQSDTSESGERRSIKPISLSQYIENAEKSKDAPVSDVMGEQEERLDGDIDRSQAILKAVFHIPPNADFVIREFTVGTERPWRALAVFIDGMSDKTIINEHILEPLMMITSLLDENPERRMDKIVKTLIPGNQVDKKSKWLDIVNGIITGSTAVFIEGCEEAVIVETKGWEHRSVGKPTTEQVVRGSHDAFTESFRANTGLVRARVRSENLITEMMSVGRVAKTDIAVMYIAGLTNSKLVEEAKRRISMIDVDFLGDSGVLEQFLEDNPRSLIPQIMSTERPDRATELLMEGHVIILIGQNPYSLAVPTVLWTLVHSSEDSYLKAPFGTFVRFIRWTAVLVAILLPGMYVALTNYHSEMLPTDLMLAIAGSREQVPFPVILEVLMMEFALELIREAGIRIPSVIGPTIGIVGALIIGQAAVQAGLVSPLLVIIVAVTALASFTIPNYNLSFAVRVMRFIFLIAAAMFGFYGIALLWTVLTVRLAVQKSFGVPFLAPVAPPSDASPDVFMHQPAYTMNERPKYLYAQKQWRQDPMTRPWSPETNKKLQSNKGKGKK